MVAVDHALRLRLTGSQPTLLHSYKSAVRFNLSYVIMTHMYIVHCPFIKYIYCITKYTPSTLTKVYIAVRTCEVVTSYELSSFIRALRALPRYRAINENTDDRGSITTTLHLN